MVKHLLVATALIGIFSAAVAAERIVCAYPAYPLPGKEPSKKIVMLEFIVDQKTAVDTKSPTRPYAIVKNNDEGVILVLGISESNKYTAGLPEVGAYVFAIERKSGKMARNNVFVERDGGAYTQGQCTFSSQRDGSR